MLRDRIRKMSREGAERIAERVHRDGCPPGPPWPAPKQLYDWIRHPVETMLDARQRYGDSFTLRFPGRERIVVTSEAAAIEAIFKSDPDELRAGEANAILEPILGPNSLLILDGPRHRRQRRLLTPPLHGERMHRYGEVMADVTNAVLDEAPVGYAFPIHTDTQRITLEVILRTVFGVEEGAERTRLRDLLTELIDGLANPLYLMPWAQVNLGPLTAYGRLEKRMNEVDSRIYDAISDRQHHGVEGRQDVLSMLVSARDEDGVAMTPQELRDEMMTLLVAGHETTATSLSWVCHRLIAHPDVAERAHEEVDRVVGKGPLDPNRIGELRYVEAVIRETLRLNPIISLVGRRLQQRTQLGSLDLPRGVVAAPCIYLTHRRPDLWPEPERFKPERFLGAHPSPFQYLPFGGGNRRCIGASFAIYEMKVVLATMLSRFRLHPAPGYRPKLVRRSITFAPSEGMPVVLRRR